MFIASGFKGVPEYVTFPVITPLPGPAMAGTDTIVNAAMHIFSNRIPDPISYLI